MHFEKPTYIFKTQMLFIFWEFLVELLQRSALAVHIFQNIDFALRQAALTQVLILFFLPSQVGYWLATFAGDCHINRCLASGVSVLPGAAPKATEGTHYASASLGPGLGRTSIVSSSSHWHG